MDRGDWQATPVHGISQARILEWLPFPSSGNLPNPRIEPVSPALVGRFFTSEPPAKPSIIWTPSNSMLWKKEEIRHQLFESPMCRAWCKALWNHCLRQSSPQSWESAIISHFYRRENEDNKGLLQSFMRKVRTHSFDPKHHDLCQNCNWAISESGWRIQIWLSWTWISGVIWGNL